MRKENLVIALFAMVLCTGFTSCGNDDEGDGKNAENVGTQNVFSAGMKKVTSIIEESYSTTFVYEGNKLVKIKEGPKLTIDITYSDNTVVATSVYKSGQAEDKFIYTMNVGPNGFVSSGKIKSFGPGNQENDGSFSCQYNNGYLTKFTISDGDDEEYLLTWKDDNLTKVVNNTKESGALFPSNVTVTYGADINTAKLAFFGDLGAELNELEYMYYAGLLGKSTSNLPVKAVESDDSDKKGETSSFTYQFGSNQYPSKMIAQYYYEGIDGGARNPVEKSFTYEQND